MRVILEDVTMQAFEGALANVKSEAARGGIRSGVTIGIFGTLLMTGAVLALLFVAEVLKFTSAPSPGGGNGVVPPLLETGPIGEPQGGLPAPLPLVPGLPPGADRK